MPMSAYYRELRKKTGTQLIFSPAVAAVIRNERGEILCQCPSSALTGDIWTLPAGAIEIGETPAEAVIREVYEETGLHVRPQKLLAALGGETFRFTYPDANQVEYVIFVFECVVQSGKLESVDGESAELRYFPVSSMPTLALPYPQEIFNSSSSERTFFQ